MDKDMSVDVLFTSLGEYPHIGQKEIMKKSIDDFWHIVERGNSLTIKWPEIDCQPLHRYNLFNYGE